MKNLNPKKFPERVLDPLCNDEYASDEEMVQYLHAGGALRRPLATAAAARVKAR